MKINLADGKYTYIFDEKTGESKALRYGGSWRDLTGDSLILAMAKEIERLEEVQEIILSFIRGEIVQWFRQGTGWRDCKSVQDIVTRYSEKEDMRIYQNES